MRGDAKPDLEDTADPSRRGEMADEAGQRDVGPPRPAVGGDEDEEGDREQDRPRRDERHDDPRRSPQDAEAGRGELVRQPRQGIAAAHGGQRQAERQQRDRDAVPDRVRARRPRQGHGADHPVAARTPERPGRQREDHAQHGDPEPHPLRDPLRRQQVTQPHADPQDGDRRDGQDGGELGRRHLVAQDVEPDGGGQQVGEMVADDDARERRQEQPLRQDRRGADPVPAAPEGAFHAAGQTSWKEQPPAGDVQVPGVDRQQRGGDDGGQRPRARPAAGDAHHDEQPDAQLGERERRCPRHREELGEGRRQEDDRLMAYRPASDWSVRHRCLGPRLPTGSARGLHRRFVAGLAEIPGRDRSP